MNMIKLVVSCVALTMFCAQAQEITDEWYRQKNASWARTRQDFPQSAMPGPFKTRMLEIDAWAKANNPALHYDPNKPYLLARMVQDEIDAAAARQRQASEQIPVTPSNRTGAHESASGGTPSQVKPTGSAPSTIWIGGIVIASVAFGAAYLFYKILRPKSGMKTPISMGRTWLAWTVALATICMLPTFFRFDYTKSIVLWLFAILIFGIPSFIIGWIIGLIKYKGDNRAASLAEDPANPSEGSNSNTRENYEFFNNLPEQQIHPEEPAIKSASPVMNNTEFEVVIPEGTVLKDGYVEMRHNTQYSLNLKNYRGVPCDAEVTIDGIHVGTWRIEPRNEIRIERPVHDTGHFTFFEVGTQEADMAGITNNADNGLVSVTFKPKKESHGLNAAPLTGRGLAAGATGLTGESQQRFRDASEIEHDMARAFTIHLRLVSRRPDIRPLAPRSTPIPPPVG